MEFVVTKVEGGVDGLEGLKINIDLLLLTFSSKNFTTVDDKTVLGNAVVKLKSLLCGSNGGKNRQSVDSGLNVRRSTVLISKHLVDQRDLASGRDNE